MNQGAGHSTTEIEEREVGAHDDTTKLARRRTIALTAVSPVARVTLAEHLAQMRTTGVGVAATIVHRAEISGAVIGLVKATALPVFGRLDLRANVAAREDRRADGGRAAFLLFGAHFLGFLAGGAGHELLAVRAKIDNLAAAGSCISLAEARVSPARNDGATKAAAVNPAGDEVLRRPDLEECRNLIREGRGAWHLRCRHDAQRDAHEGEEERHANFGVKLEFVTHYVVLVLEMINNKYKHVVLNYKLFDNYSVYQHIILN